MGGGSIIIIFQRSEERDKRAFQKMLGNAHNKRIEQVDQKDGREVQRRRKKERKKRELERKKEDNGANDGW